MSNNRIDIKRGDTYLIEATLTDDLGDPVNITDWTIRSQIRNVRGDIVATLVIAITNAALGTYTMSYAGDTALWPVATHRQDVEYVDQTGRVMSTETFKLRVVEDITL